MNVRGVIEGTVRRAGDRLRVTAQLSSASDGLVVWSDNYESKAKDVFSLQDEFTKAIVTAIAPALRGGTASSVASASRGTENLEAYDLYLKGRYFWAKRGTSALMRAIGLFNQAIAKDPKFARAYAGLALAQVILPQYTSAVGDSMETRGIANANHALVLDSTLAESELVLAFSATYQLRFADAEAHYARALRLDPSNAIGHMWHGTELEAAGRMDESLSEMRRAASLDPLSVVIGGNLSSALQYAGQFEEAIVIARKMLELDSTSYVSSYDDVAFAYAFTGETAKAIQAEEISYRLAPETPGVRGSLLFLYAAAGRWADAIKLRDDIARRNSGRADDPDLFRSDLAFGDIDGAVKILQAGVARRSYTLLTLSPGCDPITDIMKPRADYVALMRSVGIKICAPKTRWPIGPPPAQKVS